MATNVYLVEAASGRRHDLGRYNEGRAAVYSIVMRAARRNVNLLAKLQCLNLWSIRIRGHVFEFREIHDDLTRNEKLLGRRFWEQLNGDPAVYSRKDSAEYEESAAAV